MSRDLALVSTVECGERNADLHGICASTSVNQQDRDQPPVSVENITENSNNNYTSLDAVTENKKTANTQTVTTTAATAAMIVQISSPAHYNVPLKEVTSPPLNKSLNSNCSAAVCRICHEGDCVEDLISPCDCTGSMSVVHICCIEKWLSTSNSDRCEVCKYRFKTRRSSRPVIQWLFSSSSRDGPHGFCGDALCLLILTPICLTSVYLCGMGSLAYLQRGAWEGLGLAFLCLVVLITFFLWGFTTIRFHLQNLKRWRNTNQMVRLIEYDHKRRTRVQSQGNCNAHRVPPRTPQQMELHTSGDQTLAMHI